MATHCNRDLASISLSVPAAMVHVTAGFAMAFPSVVLPVLHYSRPDASRYGLSATSIPT